MIKSDNSIRVVTPNTDPHNQYLNCLWSSLRTYEIDVKQVDLSSCVSQLEVNRETRNVFHLHWINKVCYKYDPHRKLKSLEFILRGLHELLVLKFRGYQLIWTVHNSFTHECNAQVLEWSIRWFLSRLCSDIIVLSKYSQQEFTRTYGRRKRVHIVSHGNYIGAYPNQLSRTEARQKLGIAPDTILLCFGQIRRYKGTSHLITKFKQLEEPEVMLLIAGHCRDPELLAEIEQAAQADSRIFLRPEFVKDDDIQVYMNACDWVVLPYQKILNFGAALLALSFSRPVIVPQRGSLTELISDGKHGFCYAHDSDLTAALRRALATTPECWQQMCTRAYALAQKYDWSKSGAQLYQIYQQAN